MSKPSLKRFRAGKAHMRDKDQLIDFLRDEIGNMVGEIDDAFKGITFEDNFAGKIIEIPIEGLRDTRVANPLGKEPSGWIVLRSNVPSIIEGLEFDKDWLTFKSMHGMWLTASVNCGFNSATDQIHINGGAWAYLPEFRTGMQVIFRSLGGTIPGGLAYNTPYWVKAEGGSNPNNFTLSLEKNGPTVNITSAGSGNFTIAAYGTVKILLLR